MECQARGRYENTLLRPGPYISGPEVISEAGRILSAVFYAPDDCRPQGGFRQTAGHGGQSPLETQQNHGGRAELVDHHSDERAAF